MKEKMRSILTMLLTVSLFWMISGDPLIAGGHHKAKLVLESVSFNHDANSDSSDAMNIRMDYTADVHVPEWKKGQK